jgi:hypothetical protein
MSYRSDFHLSINESSGSYSNYLTTDEKKKKKSPSVLTVTKNPLYGQTSPISPPSLQNKVVVPAEEKDQKTVHRRPSFSFKGMLGRTESEDSQKQPSTNLKSSYRPSLIGEDNKQVGQKKTPSDKKTPTPSRSRANKDVSKNTEEKLSQVAHHLFDFIQEYQKCLQEAREIKEKSSQEGVSNEQESVPNDTNLADQLQKKLIAELGNQWQELRDKVDEIFDLNAMNFEPLDIDEESLTSGTRKSLQATFKSYRKSFKQEGKKHLEIILDYFQPLVLGPVEKGSLFENKENWKIMTQFRSHISHIESKETSAIISNYLDDLSQLVQFLENGAHSLLQGSQYKIDSPLMTHAIKFAKEIYKSAKKDETLATEEEQIKHANRCCAELAARVMRYTHKLRILASKENLITIPVSPQGVSAAANRLMEYLYKNESKLQVEGIFRVSGNETTTRSLFAELLTSPHFNIDDLKPSIHDVTVTLKRLFGEMHLFADREAMFLKIGKEIDPYNDSQRNETIAKLKELISTLTDYQQKDLKAMMEILYKVQEKQDVTKMDVDNLTIVFGPRLCHTSDIDLLEPVRKVTAGLIIYYKEVFS